MFPSISPVATTIAILIAGIVTAALLLSHVLERAEADMLADFPDEGSGYAEEATARMQAAIAHSAAREGRILGHEPQYLILDEDGDVETKPPLTEAQERMLHKIDLVELQTVTFERWAELEEKFRSPPSCPSFPVSLVGRGVSIPRAHTGEVLA